MTDLSEHAALRPRGTAFHGLGLDIGGTTWTLGQWKNDTVEVLEQGSTGLVKPELLSDLRDAVARRVAASDTSGSLGIAFPGGVDANGTVLYWPNRPQWFHVRLGALLGIPDGFSVEISDDGEAALRGEATLGAASGLDSVLVITCGTGLGGGAMLAGRMISAGPEEALTIGHLRALPSAEICSCGRRGCLQTALASIPPETTLDAAGFAAWPAGSDLLNSLSDFARILGIQHVVITGGTLRRPVLRRTLQNGFLERGLECRVSAHPELSALLGALVRAKAGA